MCVDTHERTHTLPHARVYAPVEEGVVHRLGDRITILRRLVHRERRVDRLEALKENTKSIRSMREAKHTLMTFYFAHYVAKQSLAKDKRTHGHGISALLN